MLESTYIIMVVMGFCFFILGIEKIATMKGIIYESVSTVFWFVSYGAGMYIHVPTDTNYSEDGFRYLCLGLGFISVIVLVLSFVIYQYNKKEREEEDRLNTVVSLREQDNNSM